VTEVILDYPSPEGSFLWSSTNVINIAAMA